MSDAKKTLAGTAVKEPGANEGQEEKTSSSKDSGDKQTQPTLSPQQQTIRRETTVKQQSGVVFCGMVA